MLIGLTKRGQSTLEYAVVIAVIVGALLATQVYIKRGIQGRFKQSSDDIGEQFSPGASKYDYTTTSSLRSKEVSVGGSDAQEGKSNRTAGTRGGATTTTVTKQQQDRAAAEKVEAYANQNEYGLGPIK